MHPDDYDYTLPVALIAQEPAAVRDQSRLMVLDTVRDTLRHAVFHDFPSFLRAGDVLVVNDTRVFPARLKGKKEDTGADVEVFLLHRTDGETWDALCRPARRLRVGTRVLFGDGLLTGAITGKATEGRISIELASAIPVADAIDRVGATPLPPYIHRPPEPGDRDRYQTVYAQSRGAVAAPTAGFHFTGALLDEIERLGVKRAAVTLHVGIGTFRPLKPEDFEKDRLHQEYCVVGRDAVETIRACRAGGGRVFAVGTTTVRALESASQNGAIEPFEGWTDLFIREPYRFRSVDAIITNFHLPRSSLLVLVSTFAGRDRVLTAYREAVRERYRFYSYGDAMLILGARP